MRTIVLACVLVLTMGAGALADKAAYLDLARKGWNYQLRTTMVGRDLTIPVQINGRDLSGAALCLVGERPNPASQEVIDAFRALAHEVYGKPLTQRYAGRDARGCGTGRTVLLRLYSGHPPNAALSADLTWMNEVYALGLPVGRDYAATSPAMAQTFFGHRGQGTHIMVQQAALPSVGALETAYFRSILIEELFQSFTFGMDILRFERGPGFFSKLQETPMRMDRLPWPSRAFMRALLQSHPGALCQFDIFMMHAVARSPAKHTVEPVFLEFIEAEYDQLAALAGATMADPRFAAVGDRECRQGSDSRI